MRSDVTDEFEADESATESFEDAQAPVVPEELIKGDWHRRLVLPNEDGQLRLTPVRKVRRAENEPSARIRYLDDNQRHSA